MISVDARFPVICNCGHLQIESGGTEKGGKKGGGRKKRSIYFHS